MKYVLFYKVLLFNSNKWIFDSWLVFLNVYFLQCSSSIVHGNKDHLKGLLCERDCCQ